MVFCLANLPCRYKRQRAECEKAPTSCEMGGFTRLLHTGKPDDLILEIPTFITNLMPSSIVEHADYAPLDRPYAFAQWLKAAPIKEKYVMMSDPDHLILKPLPNLILHHKEQGPVSYLYSYMDMTDDKLRPVIARHLGMREGDLTEEVSKRIPPTGPSPSFMSWEQLEKVVPLWQDLTVSIYKDPEAREVREFI